MGNVRFRLLGWNVLYVVLLLSILSVFSIITAAFLMVPLLYLYVKLPGKQFAVHYISCLVAVYILTGLVYPGWLSAFLMSVSLFFLPAVIQMGNLYKKKAPARTVVTAGTVTLLVELLLSLVVGYLLGFNLVARMKQFMRSSLETLPAQFKTMFTMDQDLLIQLSSQMLPLYMIGFSFFYVVITHFLTRRSLNKNGENIPGFKRIRDWKLPKSLVWYYMIALIMEHFVRDVNSVMFSILLNLVPILTFVFAVQGIAFLFYLAHRKKWNRTLPIAGIVLFVLFPPIFFILSLLGVFDVAFPIRERITSK